MASALIGPEGWATLLQEYGVICKVTTRDDVVIPAYTDSQVFSYMTKANEGE